MEKRERTSEKEISLYRFKLLEYLIKYTNINNKTNITKTVKFMLNTYNIEISRNKISEILKELYEMNDLFYNTFRIKIIKEGNGNKLYYYVERMFDNEDIIQLCNAIDNSMMVLPKESDDIISNLKSMLSIYDDQSIKEIDENRKEISQCSSIYEEYLTTCRNSINGNGLISISYSDDIKMITTKGFEYVKTYDKNITNRNLIKIHGFIEEVTILSKEPYIKILDIKNKNMKYISLFDIYSLEVIPINLDIKQKYYEIKNIYFSTYSHSYVDNKVDVFFCLEKDAPEDSINIKFKEIFMFSINKMRSEKYLIFVEDLTKNLKEIKCFDSMEECKEYINSNKYNPNIKLSKPEKKVCWNVCVEEHIFIKWALNPDIWPYIIIISPLSIVKSIRIISSQLLEKINKYYVL